MEIEKKFYQHFLDHDVDIYILKDGDLEVEILSFGAIIRSIKYKGTLLTLSVPLEVYVKHPIYCGGLIGRCANRIDKGKFILNNQEYQLSINQKNYHIHGGFNGFDKRFFEMEIKDNSLIGHIKLLDKEDGYPGNMDVKVIYKIENNSLLIQIKALCDQDSLFNPTSHSYFNLNGIETRNCKDHILQIFADKYNITNENNLPIDERKVDGTIFDFRKEKRIDDYLKKDPSFKGYDHNFITYSNHIAKVIGLKTNYQMDVYSSLPCVQLFAMLDLAFCLEPQYVPNSINLDKYPKPIIYKNKEQEYYIKYVFSSL